MRKVTLAELDERGRIASCYVTRMRLTLLAPNIVEAILGSRQGAEVTLVSNARAVPRRVSSAGGIS